MDYIVVHIEDKVLKAKALMTVLGKPVYIDQAALQISADPVSTTRVFSSAL